MQWCTGYIDQCWTALKPENIIKCIQFTGSQNHKIVEVGRHLWTLSSPTPVKILKCKCQNNISRLVLAT